jgi:Amt family ammonium transporter
LGAGAAAVIWVITEMIDKRTRKMSLYVLCSGLISGCSVTPSCGYITAGAIAIGAIGGFVCCIISMNKKFIFRKRFDDVSDVFAGCNSIHSDILYSTNFILYIFIVHGIGGALGGILTGIFADINVFSNVVNHHPIYGGWFNENVNFLFSLCFPNFLNKLIISISKLFAK